MTQSESERNQSTGMGRIEAKVDVLLGEVTRLRTMVDGNGKPGFAARLDRLEQARLTRSRVFWIAATLLITSVVQDAMQLLHKVQGH